MTTRVCTFCKTEKSIDCFYRNSKSGAIHSQCKKCFNRNKYERRKNNPLAFEKQRIKNSLRKKIQRAKMKEEVARFKKEKGCKICGFNKFSGSLLFHHNDPTQKEMGIGEMLSKGQISKYYKELDKCSVLCFNCHIALHQGLIKEERPVDQP